MLLVTLTKNHKACHVSQKESAKSRFHSLEKGGKESHQALQARGQVAFAPTPQPAGSAALRHPEKGRWHSSLPCGASPSPAEAGGSGQLLPGRSAETQPWPSHLPRLFMPCMLPDFLRPRGFPKIGQSVVRDLVVYPASGAAHQSGPFQVLFIMLFKNKFILNEF